MIRLLLLLLCVLPGFASSAQTTYTISGTVIEANSNKPMKHVLVTIQAVANTLFKSSQITKDDGRFVFENVPPGKFSLSAQTRSGSIEFFHANEDYSTAIVVGPGLTSDNIVFPFTPPGSISGTIEDEEGDPVRDAQVMLFHRAVFSGAFQTTLEKQEQSDSSGGFYFSQLAPGTYLVAVAARPWYAQNELAEAQPSLTAEFDVAYPITYCGGSTDPSSASSITVTGGASTRADITLHAMPAVHVPIITADPENENPRLVVFAIGPGRSTIPTNGTLLKVGSRLEFTGIAPGRYVAVTPGEGRRIVDLTGTSSLDLRDLPTSSIFGHLIFDGPPPVADAFVVLSSQDAIIQSGVSPDGSFMVSGVAPGHYQIQLANLPAYYIKSVEVGGRPSPETGLEVTGGSDVQVSITAAKDVSQIDGTALKDGAPFAGAMVLLLPGDLSRTSLIRRDQSDSDGTFTLPNVAPGRYTLLAIDDGRDLAYAEGAAIQPYLSRGQIIEAPPPGNSRLKVTVTVLARQR